MRDTVYVSGTVSKVVRIVIEVVTNCNETHGNNKLVLNDYKSQALAYDNSDWGVIIHSRVYVVNNQLFCGSSPMR